MSGNLSVTAANLQGWVIYVQSANDQLERAAPQIVARYGALTPTLSQAGLSGELGWRGEILETLRVAHYEKELAYAAEAADDPAARVELADRLRPTARRAASVEPPPVQPLADAP
jgi:hypothetical protein